eukprot:3895512-Rhodomonas_salina.1
MSSQDILDFLRSIAPQGGTALCYGGTRRAVLTACYAYASTDSAYGATRMPYAATRMLVLTYAYAAYG